MDITMVGGGSKWSNCRAWPRIDRFLFSTEWEEYFPVVSQRRLHRLLSDHYPLLLDCGVRGRLNLKICGCKRKVLRSRLRGGGDPTLMKVRQVMCSPES
jgi:hypothetical protein